MPSSVNTANGHILESQTVSQPLDLQFFWFDHSTACDKLYVQFSGYVEMKIGQAYNLLKSWLRPWQENLI